VYKVLTRGGERFSFVAIAMGLSLQCVTQSKTYAGILYCQFILHLPILEYRCKMVDKDFCGLSFNSRCCPIKHWEIYGIRLTFLLMNCIIVLCCIDTAVSFGAKVSNVLVNAFLSHIQERRHTPINERKIVFIDILWNEHWRKE